MRNRGSPRTDGPWLGYARCTFPLLEACVKIDAPHRLRQIFHTFHESKRRRAGATVFVHDQIREPLNAVCKGGAGLLGNVSGRHTFRVVDWAGRFHRPRE